MGAAKGGLNQEEDLLQEVSREQHNVLKSIHHLKRTHAVCQGSQSIPLVTKEVRALKALPVQPWSVSRRAKLAAIYRHAATTMRATTNAVLHPASQRALDAVLHPSKAKQPAVMTETAKGKAAKAAKKSKKKIAKAAKKAKKKATKNLKKKIAKKKAKAKKKAAASKKKLKAKMAKAAGKGPKKSAKAKAAAKKDKK